MQENVTILIVWQQLIPSKFNLLHIDFKGAKEAIIKDD
jgi:hypothetical protein